MLQYFNLSRRRMQICNLPEVFWQHAAWFGACDAASRKTSGIAQTGLRTIYKIADIFYTSIFGGHLFCV